LFFNLSNKPVALFASLLASFLKNKGTDFIIAGSGFWDTALLSMEQYAG
jgi:hypothetical protein